MHSIILERIGNILLLPKIAPLVDYVISPADKTNTWQILTVEENELLLKKIVNVATELNRSRLLTALQGTSMHLERQDNMLLLPQLIIEMTDEQIFLLKLENVGLHLTPGEQNENS